MYLNTVLDWEKQLKLDDASVLYNLILKRRIMLCEAMKNR